MQVKIYTKNKEPSLKDTLLTEFYVMHNNYNIKQITKSRDMNNILQ